MFFNNQGAYCVKTIWVEDVSYIYIYFFFVKKKVKESLTTEIKSLIIHFTKPCWAF